MDTQYCFLWLWNMSTLSNALRQPFHTTTYIFPLAIMSSFLPEKEHMREALLFCFNLKKSAAESQRMLVEAYGDSALSETTCRDWFRRFKDGNFDLRDKKRKNRPRKFEDHQLQALLDEDDTHLRKMFAEQLGVTQPAISMRLRAMEKVSSTTTHHRTRQKWSKTT